MTLDPGSPSVIGATTRTMHNILFFFHDKRIFHRSLHACSTAQEEIIARKEIIDRNWTTTSERKVIRDRTWTTTIS